MSKYHCEEYLEKGFETFDLLCVLDYVINRFGIYFETKYKPLSLKKIWTHTNSSSVSYSETSFIQIANFAYQSDAPRVSGISRFNSY